MKIIKNKKSEFGDFDLIPEDGWKLRTFVDYQSKLLIASESKIDLTGLPVIHGAITVPTKQHVINQSEQKILSQQEWKEYFNYEEETKISEDGKLKEVWIRKCNEQKDNDFYEGYLIETETNKKLIDKATSIAFYSEKRRGLIESYYDNLKHQNEHLKTLELGEFPERLYQEYLSELIEGSILIEYEDKSHSFTLKKEYDRLKLFNNSVFNKAFSSIEEFWTEFSKSDFWKIYKCKFLHPALHKFVISSHNYIVKEKILTFQENGLLYSWVKIAWNEKVNRNVYWQFCPRCKKRVMYYPRYPNHICGECSKLDVFDENGFRLSFSNEGFSGGFVVKYYQGDNLIKETNDEWGKICFIEGKKYMADEARFGGIVIQMADE